MTLGGFNTSLASQIKSRDYFQFVVNTVKKTVRQDDNLIIHILCTGLSARTSDPLNLAIIAPTAEGKTYPVVQTLGHFPNYQVWYVGRMSPKSLIRMKGELIDSRTNQPIGADIKRIRREVYLLGNSKTDKKKKVPLLLELDDLVENSKTVINLSGKVLVFLEPPDQELWEIIRPILSHDKDEIDYPYVDKDNGMVTKSVFIRGQPACIVCSAKDESEWSQWPEIASRFQIVSPNMIQEKYLESNVLIAQKAGLPRRLQQDIIVSDKDVELAKECIIHIHDEMTKFSGVWIPYSDILGYALPDEKGTDTRVTNRIFSLLRILPLVRSELRPRLDFGKEYEENHVIAILDDLGEALRLTRNSGSVPAFKMKFFNDFFLSCCDKVGGAAKMVTTRQLCDYVKDESGRKITTDNMRKTYLNELHHNGIIEEYDDYDPVTDKPKRDKLWGPLIITRQSNIASDKLSNQSNLGPLDNSLHDYALKVSRKYIEIPYDWLFFEIMRIQKYRMENGEIRIFLTGVKENEIGRLEANGDETEETETKWTQISLENFPEVFEKNDFLTRYFEMSKIEDNLNDKSFMIIKLYDEEGTHVKISRVGSDSTDSIDSGTIAKEKEVGEDTNTKV